MSDRPSSWVDRDDLASNMRWGWRTVRPDFRSRNGYRWPFPGGWAEAPGPVLDHTGPCPEHVGDGLCVALDWSGAALGGISARNPVLVVGWHPDDELGRDPSKVRIRRGYVADVWSAERILHNAPGADLTRAYLGGAVAVPDKVAARLSPSGVHP